MLPRDYWGKAQQWLHNLWEIINSPGDSEKWEEDKK
jgi:hypothetical protein